MAQMGFQRRRTAPACVSEHIESSAWLSREFLGGDVRTDGHELIVKGIGFRARGIN